MSRQDAQTVRPGRPQRAKRRGVPLRYVELLSDARTKLADFFSILLIQRGDGERYFVRQQERHIRLV
jgi:hypothetical protein